MPLNINGRIALPVSIAFGLAGIIVDRYLIPAISKVHSGWHPLVYETLALILAMLFGADFALTETSLSELLQNIEEYKAEMNRCAEHTYENITSTPKRIELGMENAKETIAESVSQAKENLSEGIAQVKDQVKDELSGHYIGRMSRSQKRMLGNMKFVSRKGERRFRGKLAAELLMEGLKKI